VFGMVDESLILKLLLLVHRSDFFEVRQLGTCSAIIKIEQINIPTDFDVLLLDSNDHTTALAAQKIANKATGDAVTTNQSPSTFVKPILAPLSIIEFVCRNLCLPRATDLIRTPYQYSHHQYLRVQYQYINNWAQDLPIPTRRCGTLRGCRVGGKRKPRSTRKEFRPYRLVALELPGHYLL